MWQGKKVVNTINFGPYLQLFLHCKIIQEKQRVGTKISDAYQVFSPSRVFIYQSTWFKKVAGSLPLISLFDIPPTPDISPAPPETPQPAPPETPQPSQVPITDSFKKGPTDNQSPTIKDTGGQTNIPGPPLPEEVPGRRRKQIFMDSGSKENRNDYMNSINWICSPDSIEIH